MKDLINIFHLVQLLGLETTMIIQYLTGNIPFKKRWRSQAHYKGNIASSILNDHSCFKTQEFNQVKDIALSFYLVIS